MVCLDPVHLDLVEILVEQIVIEEVATSLVGLEVHDGTADLEEVLLDVAEARFR